MSAYEIRLRLFRRAVKGIAIAKRDLLEGAGEREPAYLSCYPDFRDDSRRNVSLQCDKEKSPPWSAPDAHLNVASGKGVRRAGRVSLG